MKTTALAITACLLGTALAGPTNDIWNPRWLESRQFNSGPATRRLEVNHTQQSPMRARHNPAWFRSHRHKSGVMGARANGPVLDGQFMVDTAIHSGYALTQQCNPSVAFDGNNYLVAWTAYLDTLFNVGVRAARVTPSGAVLDPEGIMIDSLDGLDPVVGFDGTNYLVVDWGWDIHGFRVSPSGEVLDSTAIVISRGEPGYAWQQALAFDGTNYLVVWQEYRDSVDQIYGARVSPGGTVLDTAELAIGTGPHEMYPPAITFDGSNFLVIWPQAYDSTTSVICGTRVSPAGQVLDSGFVIDTSSGADGWYGPAATSDGTNSLVAWQDFALGLRGALVAKDGSVVDTGIAVAPPSEAFQSPTAFYDGNDFLVSWKQDSPIDGIFASRVSRAGVPLDTPGVCIAAPGYWTESPSAAFDGTKYFVTWDDDRFGCSNIYGARLTRQMSLLDSAGIGISRGQVNDQHYPSTAFDGSNYLVAWTDSRNIAGAIYGARVSPGGANLDHEGIPICTLAFHRDYPSVAFDGTNYLVAWADGRRNDSADIYAARVTKGGSVLDPQGFPVAVGGDAHIFPTAAFNGTNYLLVWDDITDSGMCTIRCARVSPAGRVLDTAGVTICSAWSAWMPVVAANGTDWLAAWHDWRNEYCVGVYAARINAAGQVLDSGGFALGAGDVEQGCAALTSDGTNYLAVWERFDESMLDVRGARIGVDGVLLDSFMVQPAVDSYATSPSVGFDGTNYGVVWVDSSWGSGWGVCGARIRPSGEVVDVTPLASMLAWHTYYPMVSMALGAGGQALCAYPCWTDEYQGRTYNTTRIWGRLGALGGIQEQAGTLVSRPQGTIVRGVLWLPKATNREAQPACLMDIGGRKVMDLRPGANDVRALAPGVYFIREEPQAAGSKPQAVRKVVLTE